MPKIMHAQTVLKAEDIEALKQKTGESSAKEAIAKAVEHYFECEYIEQEARKAVKRKRKKKPKAEKIGPTIHLYG